MHLSTLVHVDFTSIESTMELNQLPSVKNILGCHRLFYEILHGICYQGSEGKNCCVNIVRTVYFSIWCMPAKLLSDRGARISLLH